MRRNWEGRLRWTSWIGRGRFDYFQTETQVIVSVYQKGCRQDDVQLDLEGQAMHLTIKEPSPQGSLHIAPLFAPVDTVNAGIRVLATKVEVSLQKAQPGVHWPSLQGAAGDTAATAQPSSASVQGSSTLQSAPVARQRSKWDSFKDDDEEGADKEGSGAAEDASIDAFFKKLYADADEDTRRAMMKSYQESGGTSLSTNWDEVRKGRVEAKPPQGMEARKWGA